MDRIIIFSVAGILLFLISWRTMFTTKSHGFYRFISWLCITWLLANNYSYWFNDPFSVVQIFSWLCLILSIIFVLSGVIMLKKKGKPSNDRNEKTLYHFEKTSELVDSGIYRYIRHPLYSSLMFLTWGIFFKNPTLVLLLFSILSTIFLVITAIYDEKECIAFFGDTYTNYMKRSKRFIPYVI